MEKHILKKAVWKITTNENFQTSLDPITLNAL